MRHIKQRHIFFSILIGFLTIQSAYSDQGKCLDAMRKGAFKNFMPGIDSLTGPQRNLEFKGKKYNSYYDLCQSISHDTTLVNTFLKNKNEQLKGFQQSDIEHEKNRIENQLAEETYQAERKFREEEAKINSAFLNGKQDSYEEAKKKAFLKEQEYLKKQALEEANKNAQNARAALDTKLDKQFGEEQTPGNEISEIKGNHRLNEHRKNALEAMLPEGDGSSMEIHQVGTEVESEPVTAQNVPIEEPLDSPQDGNKDPSAPIETTIPGTGSPQANNQCAVKVNKITELFSGKNIPADSELGLKVEEIYSRCKSGENVSDEEINRLTERINEFKAPEETEEEEGVADTETPESKTNTEQASTSTQEGTAANDPNNLCGDLPTINPSIAADQCNYIPSSNESENAKVELRARNNNLVFTFIFDGNEFKIDNSAQNSNELGENPPRSNSVTSALNFIVGHYVNREFGSAHHQVFESQDDVEYDGLSTFRYCQKALGSENKWKEIYRNHELHKNMMSKMAQATAYSHILNQCESGDDKVQEKRFCIGRIIRSKDQREFRNDLFEVSIKAAQDCDVIARVLEENFEERRHEDSEYLEGGQKISFDSRLSCSVRSIENVDYDECSTIINAYNAAAIGKQGLGVVQQVQTQDASFDASQKMQEAQFKTTTQIGSGNQENPIGRQVNTQMLAYEVQKDMINKQKSQAQTRATLDATASASLIALSKNMPDMDDLANMCINETSIKSDRIEAVLTSFKVTVESYKSAIFGIASDESIYNDPKKYCKSRLKEMDQDFIPNKKITQTAYAIAAEFGVEAAKNSLSASMLKKQANLISDMMDRINAMDMNGEYAGLPQNEAIMKYCEAHPASPQCAALGNGTSGTVLNPGGISVTGGDYGVNELGSFEVEDLGDVDSAIDPSGGDTNEVYDGPTSNTIADVASGGEAGAIAPKAKAGPGGQRGGGGGGGGGAPSAGSRNGSPPPGAQEGQAAQGSGNNSPGVAYGKSNASYLKGGGNFGGRAKKKVANPFAKLFKGNSAGKVLNFRGPASSIGKKSDNLFSRITNRYNVVNKKDRLLKYKLAPGK